MTVFLNSHMLAEVEMRLRPGRHHRARALVVRQGAAGATSSPAPWRRRCAWSAFPAGRSWSLSPSTGRPSPADCPVTAPDCGRVRLDPPGRGRPAPDGRPASCATARGLHALIPRRTTLEDLFVQSVENHDINRSASAPAHHPARRHRRRTGR